MKSAFHFQPTNPFSTSSISPSEVVYRFAHGNRGLNPQAVDTHLESLLSKLKGSKRSLIVGPHGTGKSTLLHTFLPKLQRSFPKVAFQQLCNDPSLPIHRRFIQRIQSGKRIQAALGGLPAKSLLVVDGWEQLNFPSRMRVVRSAAARKVTLLVTCHHRMPGWTVIFETKSTPKLIRSLANDLLDDSPHEIKKLVDQHLKNRKLSPKTNIRDLWFEMYDMVEDANSDLSKSNFTA